MEPVAIIGLACRFPGASDASQLWDNARAGREAITALTDEELRAAGVPEATIADPALVKMVGLMPDYDSFDAGFFGMTPREAQVCDPQLRAFLEVSHAAVEDSGYDPFRIQDVVGVFGSAGGNEYSHRYIQRGAAPGGVSSMVASLNNVDYAATLVSYKLNFTGPSMTVVTACSSSLVAVHLACQSLRLGEVDVALAGGVNIELEALHGYLWAPGGVRSRDGHCRPFDASGGGTLFTSGAGTVVLKRLSDALADGDRIRGVIRGIAVNNDGSDKLSFGAPSISGQIACIVDAMRAAAVDPADIGYVEAHGTGTAMGDPLEVAALTKAWRFLAEQALAPGSCGIGSVKSNLGHMVQASGVASLIKLVLSLEHAEMAPTINVNELNPRLELESSPFFVNDTLRPWPRPADRPRVGAASSMGVGGTNAHVVVEAAPERQPVAAPARPQIVVWSARTETAAEAYRDRIAVRLGACAPEEFGDAARTLQIGRTPFPVRRAVVAEDAAAAARALASGELIAGRASDTGPPPVLFAFPGQGSIYPQMGRDLASEDESFARALDECWEAFGSHGGSLRELWRSEPDLSRLTPTEVAQPLLFATEYALAQSWRTLGVEPAVLLGHSVGELVAATVAGVFDLVDAARLVLARAAAMARMPAGAMAAVLAPPERVTPPDGLVVAAVNGPAEVVVAGPAEDIDNYLSELSGSGVKAVRLRTSHAFHSPGMAGAVEEFQAAFDGVGLKPPAIPLVSCATARQLTPEQAVDPSFWARQLVEPVRFADAVRAVFQDGEHDVVEVGPGRVLCGLVERIESRASGVAVPTLPGGRGSADQGEWASRLAGVASLWVRGHSIHWSSLEPERPIRRVEVPGYPYQRVRHWVDPEPAPGSAAMGRTGSTSGPRTDAEPEPEPFATLGWYEEPLPPDSMPRETVPWGSALRGSAPSEGEPALTLLPEDPTGAVPMLSALSEAGYHVVPVRLGQEYHDQDGDLRVRLSEPGDVARIVRSLAARGTVITQVVHALGLEPWQPIATDNLADQLSRSVHSVLALVQGTVRAGAGGTLPRVLVLARGVADVSGDERVDPIKSGLIGLVRTLALEEPRLRPVLVDIGAEPASDLLVAQLRAAATAPAGPATASVSTPVVALRGSRRWVAHEAAYQAGPATSPLRREGGYLITGGTGGLGLELARGLARTGLRPRIVLVARNVPPDPAAGQPETDDSRWADVTAAIRDITMLGGSVRCLRGDIADPRQARRIVDIATAQLGAIDGVFHLAGVAGDGMLLLRDRERVDSVLRPKVYGAVALAEALRDRTPPDFVVYFSSLAGARGFVGGGDYAAANAILDAIASQERGRARVLSIGWPAWAGAGMAEPMLAAAEADRGSPEQVWETTLSPANTWALDEHRVDGHPVLPGTGHLDLVVRAFRQCGGAKPDAALRLTEVLFQLPLSTQTPVRVRVVFHADGERWSFRVESSPVEGAGADWRTHSRGYLATVTDPARTVDVEALRSRFPDPNGAASPRPTGERRMFRLGPRWNNAASVRRVGGEVLAEVRLPDAFLDDLATHPLHPALLDTATGVLREPDRDGPHLPFLYRSMVVYSPLPATVISHLRRHDSPPGSVVGDLDIVAPDGRVLVEIEGFTMREVDSRSFSAALTTPDPAVDSTPASAPAAPAVGLPPETGVRLLLHLLGAQCPPQVLVQPHRDGRPAPSAGRPLGAPVRPAPAPAPRPAAAELSPEPARPFAPVAAPTAAAEAPPHVAAGAEPVLPALGRLWAEVLGGGDVQPEDDFFHLGGDSMSAVELMTAIRRKFGVELSIATLLDSPTLGAQAAALERAVAD